MPSVVQCPVLHSAVQSEAQQTLPTPASAPDDRSMQWPDEHSPFVVHVLPRVVSSLHVPFMQSKPVAQSACFAQLVLQAVASQA